MDGKKKVLFYGAGEHAAMIYRHAKRKSEPYGEPTAFIDRDIYKQGHDLFGLPVISWEDAQRLYGGDFYIYVTGNEKAAPDILGFLQEQGVPPERIINWEPVEKRIGCGYAEANLTIGSLGDKIRYFNCSAESENLIYREKLRYVVEHTSAAQPSVICNAIDFVHKIAQKISEGDEGKKHANCANMREQYFFADRKIRMIFWGGSGSCNFKCSYCPYHTQGQNNSLTYHQYVVFQKILKYLEEEKYIDEHTVIKIASGEFAIEKGGNEFAEMAGKYPVCIFTNASVFSRQAAQAIENSGMLFCSMDAGTSETFYKIKGVNAFEKVSKNLREYAKYGSVCLKYILLDGINDTQEDLEGFIQLADEVAVRVDFTRDFMDVSGRFSDHALEFAARFIKHFRDVGKLNMNMGAFVRSGERDRLERMLEAL